MDGRKPLEDDRKKQAMEQLVEIRILENKDKAGDRMAGLEAEELRLARKERELNGQKWKLRRKWERSG